MFDKRRSRNARGEIGTNYRANRAKCSEDTGYSGKEGSMKNGCAGLNQGIFAKKSLCGLFEAGHLPSHAFPFSEVENDVEHPRCKPFGCVHQPGERLHNN